MGYSLVIKNFIESGLVSGESYNRILLPAMTLVKLDSRIQCAFFVLKIVIPASRKIPDYDSYLSHMWNFIIALASWVQHICNWDHAGRPFFDPHLLP